MAREKKQKDEGGGDEWMTTYSDMVTLLLTFFVLLLSFANMDEPKYLRLRDLVQEMKGSAGQHDKSIAPPEKTILDMMFKKQATSIQQRRPGGIRIETVNGKHVKALFIRQGIQFVVGGPASFDKGSYELRDDAKETLGDIIKLTRGYSLRIQVRGHTSTDREDALAVIESPEGRRIEPYKNKKHKNLTPDHWLLSYLRAQAVTNFLITGGDPEKSELNWEIDPRRIQVIAQSSYDPVGDNMIPEAALTNMRVEVILTEEETEKKE